MTHSDIADAFERMAARFDRCQSEADFRAVQPCMGRLLGFARKAGLFRELPQLAEYDPLTCQRQWATDANLTCMVLGMFSPTLQGALPTGGYTFTGQINADGSAFGVGERRGNWLARAREGHSECCRILARAAEAAGGNGRVRGRGGATAAQRKADDSLAAAWERASAAGVEKKDFCADLGISPAALDACLDRVRKRRARRKS